jgi:hypothetical protein
MGRPVLDPKRPRVRIDYKQLAARFACEYGCAMGYAGTISWLVRSKFRLIGAYWELDADSRLLRPEEMITRVDPIAETHPALSLPGDDGQASGLTDARRHLGIRFTCTELRCQVQYSARQKP